MAERSDRSFVEQGPGRAIVGALDVPGREILCPIGAGGRPDVVALELLCGQVASGSRTIPLNPEVAKAVKLAGGGGLDRRSFASLADILVPDNALSH